MEKLWALSLEADLCHRAAGWIETACSTTYLVVVGAILGGLGLYDRLVDFAGAGASVPISFGNQVVQGACGKTDWDHWSAWVSLRSRVQGFLQSYSALASLIFKPKDSIREGGDFP